jgi:hypothetical protein
MKLTRTITAVIFFLGFAIFYLAIPSGAKVSEKSPVPSARVAPTPTDLRESERRIAERERNRRGISIDRLRVYDDAMLQQMLQAAEARLASLQLIDQTQILSRLGAMTGASQQISSLGVNVQGAPIPGVVTTTKLPTLQTTTTTAAGASNSGVTTVSGLATEDTQTTNPQLNAPTSTAPAPTTTLPSSGFSVASSDILNEQMQLTAEINSLRLMLAGDLSGHFVDPQSPLGAGVAKFKTTLGFPITLSPDDRYKDAVAVVEAEVKKPNVQNGCQQQYEDPMITALLPREKTYNVAAITDKSVSIGGGVATQILGVSGSFLTGRKTYYLVQDQDTVAKTFSPEDSHTVGFEWEFRPVLGQRYVRGGLKQTFVQLSFAAPPDAKPCEIGTVTMRTYWRRYDRKRGIPGAIIRDSLSPDVRFEIPAYTLANRAPAFTPMNVEDIGSGQIMVNLKGRYLPGTYIRIGSKIINNASGLISEYGGLRFTASIADASLRDTYLVAHDGREVLLSLPACGTSRFTDTINHVKVTQYLPIKQEISAIDDATSLVKVKFVRTVSVDGAKTPVQQIPQELIPELVLVIGQRAYGYSQLKVECSGGYCDQISTVVPTSTLNARTDLSIQTVFPGEQCRAMPVSIAAALPASPAKLAVLERGANLTTFLFSGSNLSKWQVVSPRGAMLSEIGTDPNKLRVLTLTAGNLASNKQVLFRKGDGSLATVAIPELDPPKPTAPKALESVTVGSDEAFVVGDGLGDIESVSFRDQAVDFELIDKGTMRVKGLKAVGLTSAASTQTLVLKSKTGAKTKVTLKVVDSKVEVQDR